LYKHFRNIIETNILKKKKKTIYLINFNYNSILMKYIIVMSCGIYRKMDNNNPHLTFYK